MSTTNYGALTNYSYIEINQQSTKGLDISTGKAGYSTTYSYPLFANTTEIVYPNGDFILDAYISRSMDTSVLGTPVFTTGLQAFSAISSESSLLDGLRGTFLSTTQNGSASYVAKNNQVIAFGSTNQEMKFGGADLGGGLDAELYYGNVEGVNRTVVRDQQVLLGKTVTDFGIPIASVGEAVPRKNILSPKAACGRGPGSVQAVLVQGAGSG